MRTRIQSGGLTITNFCNLNCIHCYAGTPVNPTNMPYDKIVYFLEEFTKFQAKEIVLTGGEPLLHPDILPILDFAGRRYPSIPIVITTNGTLVDNKIVDLYQKYDNLTIQFSLDGYRQSTHEAQHDKNTFDRVIFAISSFQNIPKNRKTIRMTISKLNYMDVVDVAKLAKQYGCGINYSYVCRAGRAVDNWELLKMSLGQMVVANEKIRRYGVIYPEENVLPPKSVQSCPFESEEYVFGLNIDPLGYVNVCTCLGSEYIIGNAYEDSLMTIINSTRIDCLRKRIIERKKLLRNTKCQGCSALQKCQQGCIGRAARNGDELGLDDQCDFRKALQFKNLFLFSEKLAEERKSGQ